MQMARKVIMCVETSRHTVLLRFASTPPDSARVEPGYASKNTKSGCERMNGNVANRKQVMLRSIAVLIGAKKQTSL